MKKTIVTILLCLSIFLTACGSKSAIQSATGADKNQNIVITEALEAVGIDYEIINEANHNKPDIDLKDGWKVYNVIDRDAVNYFLVLDADLNVISLWDNELNVLGQNALHY